MALLRGVNASNGTRRSWFRGIESVSKRNLIAVAMHNLGRILRMLFGIGNLKALQGQLAIAQFCG